MRTSAGAGHLSVAPHTFITVYRPLFRNSLSIIDDADPVCRVNQRGGRIGRRPRGRNARLTHG